MTTFIKNQIGLASVAILASVLMISCSGDKTQVESIEAPVENVLKSTMPNMAEGKEEIDLAEATTISNESATPKGEWTKGKTYDMTQVDRPPLFDTKCKGMTDEKKCSDEKLLAYISDNIKTPNYGKQSLEQVLVVIEKDGSLRDVKYVASGNKKNCSGCQQAAVDIVGAMDNWVPAQKDGKPVAVKMSIPVRI